MPWNARPAVADDALRIAQIQRAGWLHAYRGLVPDEVLDRLDPADAVAERIRTVLEGEPRRSLFVAADPGNGRLGAYCAVGPPHNPERDTYLHEPTGEISALYADPPQLGTGAGHAAHTAALGHLAAAGYQHAVLWVLQGNELAIRFYTKHGWLGDGAEDAHEVHGHSLPVTRYHRPLP